jgi:hypothetical protein
MPDSTRPTIKPTATAMNGVRMLRIVPPPAAGSIPVMPGDDQVVKLHEY